MMQAKDNKVTAILIENGTELSLPENFPICEDIKHLQKAACVLNVPYSYAYGALRANCRIWKQRTTRYIAVNAGKLMPKVTEEALGDLYSGKIRMILPRVYCVDRLQENYRKQFYGFDFRLLLTVLKREYPDFYKHAKENVLDKSELILFGGLFAKEEYNRICGWMFAVLEKCARVIPKRVSDYQNEFLEHLVPYLFTIYVTYWEEKHPYLLELPVKLKELSGEKCEGLSEDERKLEKAEIDGNKPIPASDASKEEILDYMDALMQERRVEDAVSFAQGLPRSKEDLEDIRWVFTEYTRQRRYQKLTDLDEAKDWKDLLGTRQGIESPGIKCGKPKMLIFQWNSIGHKINVRAFESFGFECHTIQVPYERGKFDEDCLEQLNVHLDRNQFDLAFSLNCIGMVAEACYTHDIPYIAWCYDSPSFTGAHWYLKYPTTHVFLFDSDDAAHYREAGITQAHYMPLAVNLEYFDGIVCTQEDKEKYSADVSFVGSLYDTELPQAMGYLTDYQKGYLNALMDNQLDVYGHSFFPGILSNDFMEWLSHPEFNRLLNAEFDKEKAKEDTAGAGRLQLILNKQTTNKERLLLLNLMAKYHEVKLYSYKNSKALKGLTFCGTADYYTEMPKIFRFSKININATLRSIQHGIPLRCLDIMGCHGVLLTNYQKDFDDHFVDGENVLFYTDAGEALEKASFYLAHDSLRERIAEAGYETVKRYYDYPVKIREIMILAELEHLIPARSRS